MKHLTSLAIVSTLLTVACTPEPTIIEEPVARSRSASSQLSPHPSPLPEGEGVPSSSSVPSVAATSVPASIRIDMPFASQAPHGNWDMPYQEACEEASLILVHHYLSKEAMSADIMDRAILDMVAHEESKGLPADIDMNQLVVVAEELYGYDATVYEGSDVTIERIEQELANGNPVILPLAGQDIGNPYFSGDGPPYHVLVVLGYDSRNFITHDVGTRHGANYSYKKEVLMSAIHDWTGDKDMIRSGPRRMLVVTE